MDEGHLEQREVEDENSLEMVGLPYFPEGPWSLGGMQERGAGEAHEEQLGHHRRCVRTEDLGKLGPLMKHQEADARRVVEVVWFWDKSLVKVIELLEVVDGPS